MTSIEEELRKTNANLQTMINMQKMIIDALMEKAEPTEEELESLKFEEFIPLKELKKELKLTEDWSCSKSLSQNKQKIY